MTKAHICICDDVMSNHKKKTFKDEGLYQSEYVECMVDGCPCKKFELVEIIPTCWANYRGAKHNE